MFTPVSQQGGTVAMAALCLWYEVHCITASECRCHLVVDNGTGDGWGHICIASLELYSVHSSPFVRRESSTVSKIDCTALVLALMSDHAFHIDCSCAVLACFRHFSILYIIFTKGSLHQQTATNIDRHVLFVGFAEFYLDRCEPLLASVGIDYFFFFHT